MFDKLFRENIKTTMHWSDIQFDLFVHLWKELHTQNVTSIKKSYIYTPEYFELILSLYFIVLQLDLKEEITERKAILLCVLLFYAVSEEQIGKQSEHSLEVLSSFLLHLLHHKLISIPCLKYTLALLNSFSDTSTDILSDKDYSLLLDLLTSTNPIVVDRKHAMFYYDNPQESIFAVKKPYPTPTQFFDEMFKISGRIQSKMLKGFYVDRLHRLMDTQAKKSIFPF